MANRSAPSVALLAFALVASVACEASAPAAPTIAVDSAGLQIVVSDPYRSDAVCSVGAEPLLVVGDREDDPAHMFAHLAGATRLSDGSVAVVDETAGEVRLFDAAGEHIRSFGRFGEGPGEFSNPWFLWTLPGDTLWVGDYRPWRYHVFTSDGEWSRAVQVDPLYLNPSQGGGVLATGALVTARRTHDRGRSFRTPDTLVVEVHHPDGKLSGVLARLPHRRWGQLSEGPPNFRLDPLFDPWASVAAFGDYIAMGTTDKPEVRILDSQYRLIRIVRWEDDDRAVTGADVAAYRDELLARRGGEPSPYDAALMSRDRPVAEVLPAFSGVLVGGAGHLWVFRYRRPGVEVRPGAMVFAPTGEFLCHMPTMKGYSVLEAGADYVLGQQEDDLGIQWVVMHRFGPPATPM